MRAALNIRHRTLSLPDLYRPCNPRLVVHIVMNCYLRLFQSGLRVIMLSEFNGLRTFMPAQYISQKCMNLLPLNKFYPPPQLMHFQEKTKFNVHIFQIAILRCILCCVKSQLKQNTIKFKYKLANRTKMYDLRQSRSLCYMYKCVTH